MIAELYDALKEAGASEEKAKAAAVALADYANRFDDVDSQLALTRTDLAAVKAESGMVKWIVSGVGVGVVLLVLRSFWPA